MAEHHSHSSSLVRKTTTEKGKEKRTLHDRQLRHFPRCSEPDKYESLRSHQDLSKSSKARKDEQFLVIRRAERPVVPASTQLSPGLSKLQVSSCNLTQSTQDHRYEYSCGKYASLRAFQDSTDISAATTGNPLAPKSTQKTVGLKYVTGQFLTKGDYNSASCLSRSSTERLSDEAYPFTTGGLNKVLKTHPVEKTSAAVSQAQVAMNYKAIPLCLPDNLHWDPRTGEIQQRRQERRKLNVVKEAITELQKIKDPICVLAIVGPCRDGKSFILSETFDQGDAFPVGYKTDPETMGIWMWILPHIMQEKNGRNYKVVLMDSEGIDAAVAKGQSDNQIFTLTTLLSSILIYNSKNVPKRSDLDGLNFVVRLSRQIKVTSQGGTQKNEDAFHKTFPHFVWLLRDVLTELPSDCKNIKDYFLRRARSDIKTKRPTKNKDAFHRTFPHFIWLLRDVMTDIPDDCKNIKDYFLTRVRPTKRKILSLVTKRISSKGSPPKRSVLSLCLRCQRCHKVARRSKVFKSEEASKMDQNHLIAESILHYFSGFDAFCLPPPSFNKKHLKDIRKYKDNLNPEFFSEVKQFEELLRSIMGPKKSCNDGEFVTGEGLATLTKLYVDAINDPNNVPNLQTAWETHVQGKRQEAKRKALVVYDNKMKKELSKLPCDGEKLLASHESASREMMAVFGQETDGISSDRIKVDYEELTNKGLEKLSEWKNKNDKLTKQICEKLVKDLKEKHLDPVLQRVHGPQGEKVSFTEIDDGCAIIELEYKSHAEGSKEVRAKVFHKFHQQFQIERDRCKYLLKKLKDYNEDLLNIRLANTKKEEEMEELRTKNDYLMREKKIQDDKKKELEAKTARELQDKLKEFQVKEDILNKKIFDMEKAGMESKICVLEKERNAIEENERQKREIQDLKREFSDLREQIRPLNRPFWKRLFNIDG